jgi:ABC-2 type transport system permease protein
MFLAFVSKEGKHVLRDRRSLVTLLGLPVAMMVLFGFALSNEVKDSAFVVVDPTPDAASIALVARLEASRYFTYAGSAASEPEVEAWFRRGEARLALLFPGNFAHDLHHLGHAQLRLLTDASDANTANTITGYATSIIAQYQAEVARVPAAAPGIQVETRMLYNPQLKSSYMFVPGVMTVILMLLGSLMTSVSIVREKEQGTMEVLLVSPMHPLLVIVGKAVPYSLLCLTVVAVILALAYGVLGMPPGANIPLLLAESLLYIITTLAFGLAISNLVERQQTAMFVALVGLLMPALVFSGFMFPVENMPLPLRLFSNLVPTRWFFLIISDIMIKHLGFAAVVEPTLVLAGTTVALLVFTWGTFKQRL